jgi:hypothetical protein
LTGRGDDAIVVTSRVQDGSVAVQRLIVPPELRTRLGVDASEGLVEMFGQYHQFATDRFERQLAESRLDLRLEIERGLTGMRVELERTRADAIKWNLVFWIGQFAAVTAVLSFMLDGR